MIHFKAIAAVSLNNVIANKGAIPWHLPDDLKWFKEMTLGQIIVMGRKTFETFPKPLPGRTHIVLSRQKEQLQGATVIQKLEDLVFHNKNDKDIWIIGGAQIYELALPYCTDLYLTVVKKEVLGDTFFPSFEPPFIPIKVLRDEPEYKIIHYMNPEVMEL